MTTPNRDPLRAAILHLLRPLVRILLQHRVPYDAFADLAKWVYADVAWREFGIPGRKQSIARVSVLTGLNRKEVDRVRQSPPPTDEEHAHEYNRAAKVVSGWVRAYPMQGNANGIATLPLDGEKSFSSLVRRYSGDMPVRAVLDELLRLGAVRKSANDQYELVHRHYLPPQGEARKLVYLGDDTADLISTISHNLSAPPDETFLQRKVFYDNIPLELLPNVREIARRMGEPFIDSLVTEMSAHDRDITSGIQGTGRMRAVVGIYYYEEAVEANHETQVIDQPWSK